MGEDRTNLRGEVRSLRSARTSLSSIVKTVTNETGFLGRSADDADWRRWRKRQDTCGNRVAGLGPRFDYRALALNLYYYSLECCFGEKNLALFRSLAWGLAMQTRPPGRRPGRCPGQGPGHHPSPGRPGPSAAQSRCAFRRPHSSLPAGIKTNTHALRYAARQASD
jgi:hypothetical protein